MVVISTINTWARPLKLPVLFKKTAKNLLVPWVIASDSSPEKRRERYTVKAQRLESVECGGESLEKASWRACTERMTTRPPYSAHTVAGNQPAHVQGLSTSYAHTST